VAGGLFFTAMAGTWSETLERYLYKVQGGGGEGAYWGEPMFYALMMLALPNPSTLAGALLGAGAAFRVKTAANRAGGVWPLVQRHLAAVAVAWTALVVLAGWFVYVQWDRAREGVARYRASTSPAVVIRTPDPVSVERTRADCERGKGGACTALGQMYRLGEGVPTDLRRAVESYERGCALGFGAACHRLGVMHQHGQGVTAAAPVAAGFYAKGCDAGYAEACREAGLMHQRGAPAVARDAKRAVDALQKACALRDGWSCFTVGLMYEKADGVERSFPQAAAFYEKACDVPYAMGCVYLGDSYAHGEGVARDAARAASLYARGAGLLEQDCGRGDAYGCHAAGTMYQKGQGVAADAGHASRLFDQGCRAGNQDACAARRAAR
jgi:hypothetical protein